MSSRNTIKWRITVRACFWEHHITICGSSTCCIHSLGDIDLNDKKLSWILTEYKSKMSFLAAQGNTELLGSIFVSTEFWNWPMKCSPVLFFYKWTNRCLERLSDWPFIVRSEIAVVLTQFSARYSIWPFLHPELTS